MTKGIGKNPMPFYYVLLIMHFLQSKVVAKEILGIV